MLARFISALFALIVLSAVGCRKDDLSSPDCGKLQQAILAGNPDEVEAEINNICASLSASNDSEQSFNEITKAIGTQCKLNAVALCYNCIETLPAQSEIKITVQTSTGFKEKIIDITRSGNHFIFAGMHD
ncbi:MAG: hypothetical protein QM764_01340 [Chitinophagaceae bacterium]